MSYWSEEVSEGGGGGGVPCDTCFSTPTAKPNWLRALPRLEASDLTIPFVERLPRTCLPGATDTGSGWIQRNFVDCLFNFF